MRIRVLPRGVYDVDADKEIPADPSNPDWQAYIAALGRNEVEFIAPAPPAEPDTRYLYVDSGRAREERRLRRLSNEDFLTELRKGKG